MSKIALVTGGSRGLGRNMCLAIARKGFDLVLTYHSRKAEADAVVAEIEALGRKAQALQLDVSTQAGFPAFVASLKKTLSAHWGVDRLDFLVNNAGVGVNVPFAQTTEQQFDQMMNVHLKSVYFLTQALLPVFNDGGRIVNISSGLARFSLPGFTAYGAMKGAVEVMTRYLAMELGPRRISVNVVAPGAIETDFGGGYIRDNKDANALIASRTALGRAGLPDDIGPVVASLLSEDTRWINGQRIEVSGGIFL